MRRRDMQRGFVPNNFDDHVRYDRWDTVWSCSMFLEGLGPTCRRPDGSRTIKMRISSIWFWFEVMKVPEPARNLSACFFSSSRLDLGRCLQGTRDGGWKFFLAGYALPKLLYQPTFFSIRFFFVWLSHHRHFFLSFRDCSAQPKVLYPPSLLAYVACFP